MIHRTATMAPKVVLSAGEAPTARTGATVVAIVDDDPVHAGVVADWLTAAGYTCSVYTDGSSFLRSTKQAQFDLVLLDWVMPGDDGRAVLHQLREQHGMRFPVVFVSVRDHEDDVTAMLDAGADDYMCKPVRKRILLAKIESLLRRCRPTAAESPYVVGDILVYAESRQIFRNGVEVPMTSRELDLALFLLRHRDVMHSRVSLLEGIWGISHDLNTRTVDAFIHRLRKRLGLDGSAGLHLRGVRHRGYILTTTPPASSPEAHLGQTTPPRNAMRRGMPHPGTGGPPAG